MFLCPVTGKQCEVLGCQSPVGVCAIEDEAEQEQNAQVPPQQTECGVIPQHFYFVGAGTL